MSPEIALFVGLLLLAANAFFVGAEFSMVSVRRSSIEPAAAKGSKRAIATLKALENISVLMAGAQLGITLCSLGLGAVAEPAIAHLLEGPFHDFGLPDYLLHPVAVAIALTVTVFLHVVVGEMVPKNIAIARPDRSALILTPALVFVVRILKPVVYMLNYLANLILTFAGVRPQAEVSSTYTRDEMADLVRESKEEGYISEDNVPIVSGALEFDKRTAMDVAIGIENLSSIDKRATYEEVENLSSVTGYSRFPMRDDKGGFIGYVHIKDVIRAPEELRRQPIKRKDVRKLVSVSAGQSIRMTLKIMQSSGSHIALVIKNDKPLGVVALEDVLEELVGEMRNQFK